MEKQDKIVVTGSTGMIGAALVRALNKQGFAQVVTPTRAQLDLCDRAAVDAFFNREKPRHVFHLAAKVGGIHANQNYPAQFVFDNTTMQCNVIDAAYRAGVEKLLFPGSACTYPKMAPQPVNEEEFLNGRVEQTNLAYASAKINGIVMAQSYRRQYGFKTIVPMPTNTYGVGDNFSPDSSHVIPALMRRFHEAAQQSLPQVVMWGSGTPLREFIYVDDVADALIFLMQHYDDEAIINVGTMQEISMQALAEKLAAIVGYRGEIVLDTAKPDGAPRKCLDSGRLFALGWKPQTDLARGLQAMYTHHFKGSA